MLLEFVGPCVQFPIGEHRMLRFACVDGVDPQLAQGEDFAESAKRAGVSYAKLIERIIGLGLQWRPSRMAAQPWRCAGVGSPSVPVNQSDTSGWKPESCIGRCDSATVRRPASP